MSAPAEHHFEQVRPAHNSQSAASNLVVLYLCEGARSAAFSSLTQRTFCVQFPHRKVNGRIQFFDLYLIDNKKDK